LLLMLIVPFFAPEFLIMMVPELMLATHALAAAAMLDPVYLVEPSTRPVQVLPVTNTSPEAADSDEGVIQRPARAATDVIVRIVRFMGFSYVTTHSRAAAREPGFRG
jgi:hypothetical protein